MITIEEASRSVDIMIGISLLILLAVVVFAMFRVDMIRKKAKAAVSARVASVRQKMTEAHKTEIHAIETRHFAERTSANIRIRELERQLAKIQKEYDILIDITRRAENGKK